MNIKPIDPIAAEWGPGEDQSEDYRLISLVHSMAGVMARSKVGGWKLSKSCATFRYEITEWTNGIVEVGAETHKTNEGKAFSHQMYLRPVATPNELEGE